MAVCNPLARGGAALSAAMFLAATVSGCAATGAASGPITDEDGMTLYIFERDERGSGESACYGSCAENWPPVPAGNAGGPGYGSIMRVDGVKQLTYEGWPVYYFAGDRVAGEMNGDGLGNVWHVLRHESAGDGRSGGDY
jgi:predicted lipoprotein with Yx(FWY)xxD motif